MTHQCHEKEGGSALEVVGGQVLGMLLGGWQFIPQEVKPSVKRIFGDELFVNW